MSQLPKRLVIVGKANGPVWEKKFFLEIEEAINSGYRLAKNPYSVDCTMRNYLGFMGRAVLYLQGYEPLEDEPKGIPRSVSSLQSIEEESNNEILVRNDEEKDDKLSNDDCALEVYLENIDNLSKKKELLDYAEGIGLEIPTEMSVPSQIKKFIKESRNR